MYALATLAVAGTAFAQSSVTLSGTYSVSYQKDLTSTVGNSVYAPTTTSAGTNATAAAAAVGKGFAVTDANFKLAAVEDLGGGLKASFDTTFETGAQRGAALTRADSGIALANAMGTVSFRNTRTSDLIASIGSSAVSLPDGLYDSSNIVARGATDVFGVSLPLGNGLTASVSYAELTADGNIALSGNSKSAMIYGLSYAAGPLAAAVVVKNVATPVASGDKKSNYEFSASYDFGVAKVAYAFDGKTKDTDTSTEYEKSANGFSVTVPAGALTFGANYFKRGTYKVSEVGASYALSKRTAVTVSTGKQTADNNGNQYRVKVAHSF